MRGWQIRERTLELRRPLVLGIVNITPDSFSDGGRYLGEEAALAHALRLVEEGADLLDLGGESTRPGSSPVGLEEELRRLLPVVKRLAREVGERVPLSIDTTKAEVAQRCLDLGAHIINDITALQGDLAMGEVIRRSGAGVILMHMQGTPATMQQAPHYDDVVEEVANFLQARLHVAAGMGIAAQAVVLDPGIGFGKTDADNLALLAHLGKLQSLGCPVCLGVSRKGFLGRLLGREVQERLAGALAVTCHALVHRAAQILRVHDVRQTRDVVEMMSHLDEASIRDAHGRGGGASQDAPKE